MNQYAFEAITALLDAREISYVTITHEPSKTSDESRFVRERAGYPNTEGAKALLTKLYFTDRELFATIVLPGSHVLAKESLQAHMPGLKKMRFATEEELDTLAGVVPGCMPPFAAPIFPDIPFLIVASALADFERIGFNAAYLEKSIILPSKEYLRAVTPTHMIPCSISKSI